MRNSLPEGFAAFTFWLAGIGFVLTLGGFLALAWWRGWLR